jgi:hypothetical protein
MAIEDTRKRRLGSSANIELPSIKHSSLLGHLGGCSRAVVPAFR